jgi:hypothetical protein
MDEKPLYMELQTIVKVSFMIAVMLRHLCMSTSLGDTRQGIPWSWVGLTLGFKRGYSYGVKLLVITQDNLCFEPLVVQLPRQHCPCISIK